LAAREFLQLLPILGLEPPVSRASFAASDDSTAGFLLPNATASITLVQRHAGFAFKRPEILHPAFARPTASTMTK